MRKLLYVFLIIFIAVALVLGIKVSKKDPMLPASKDYDYMTCEGTLDNPDELPLLQKDNLSVTLLNVFTNTLKEEDLKSLNLTEVEINNVMIQADNDNFIALVKFESLDGTSVNELSCDFQIYDIVDDTCNIYLSSITQVEKDLMRAFSRFLDINSGNTNYKFNRIGSSYKRFIIKQDTNYSIVLFSTQIPEENQDLANKSDLNVLIINPQYQNDSGEKIVFKDTFFDLVLKRITKEPSI